MTNVPSPVELAHSQEGENAIHLCHPMEAQPVLGRPQKEGIVRIQNALVSLV